MNPARSPPSGVGEIPAYDRIPKRGWSPTRPRWTDSDIRPPGELQVETPSPGDCTADARVRPMGRLVPSVTHPLRTWVVCPATQTVKQVGTFASAYRLNVRPQCSIRRSARCCSPCAAGPKPWPRRAAHRIAWRRTSRTLPAIFTPTTTGAGWWGRPPMSWLFSLTCCAPSARLSLGPRPQRRDGPRSYVGWCCPE